MERMKGGMGKGGVGGRRGEGSGLVGWLRRSMGGEGEGDEIVDD